VTVREKPRQSAWFYLELSVLWFALAFLWSGMISIVIQTLVKQMAGDQKDLVLGWTLAAGALVSTLVCLIVGTMSDRSKWRLGRRRPYILVGAILAVPALLALNVAHSIPLLMLDFCLIQLWTNVATAPYQALVPDLVPKERQGRASTFLGLADILGNLGGLILSGALISRPGGLWTLLVTFSAVLLVAALYVAVRMPETSAAEHPAPPLGFWATLSEAFRFDPREHPDFSWLIASRFTINMGFYSATEFLLYYVGDTLHAPNPTATFTQIALISTIAGVLGNVPAGLLSDRISKKRVVYASIAITGVAALAFVLARSIPPALGAAFIFGAGFGAFKAVDWAFATNLIPDRDEAKYMGVWHIAFTVPQVVAPFIGGMVAYYFNQQLGQGVGYRVVLSLVLLYLIGGALLIHPIRERVIAKGGAVV
jgi:MFS family permease